MDLTNDHGATTDDLTERIAETLAPHRLDPGMNICICWHWQATTNAGSLRGQYDVHLAAELAPLFAAERARAWDEGRRLGSSRAMRHMSDEPALPLASEADNPYL